ncbi:endolytic transglycosylase MltG [Oscillochloris sp. ZM17-4]|uniref:endolytic transglycosylase MltG n=1 Tax=Oscillochloris sp. ZM17-4 TaxID=2866714 RepID=UPI001C730501|nr:endolytic transglycosylase MltG [Oscillochloris sp. ZM17-4]MBX0327047.1 endolytic transglycosylase MltG [Oscillochloris sp. ZM17-4]
MRHVRALMLGIALIALVVSCGGYVALGEIRAAAAAEGDPVEFIVAPGEATADIATRLSSEDLIRQPAIFTLLARLRGLDGKLQAGRYILSPTMTMSEIMIALQSSRVEEAQLTVPEGLRLEEIAAIVEKTGVVSADAFLRAARDGERFRDQYFLLNSLPQGASLEGYLFPDTYRVAKDASADQIVATMLDRFAEQYGTIERDVRVPDVTVHQIMTMASIVQREAALTSEMPTISAVFWNRLRPENAPDFGGGQLGADPTVQYALGYSAAESSWWRKTLTAADLQIDSPYNTRRYPGLPPGPIAAPGLDALRAAAQPDESAPYLFFVASCAKDGSHKFASTLQEFQIYEAEYLACQ